ncbi:uncharacterized protein [Macrobrachium rosenbergii]|uniref:uncharacterized protein isoform X2 n=1 Tax=Macrobrachium rosenbergii TaxID=79674 RepID=UPI0034D4244F
MSSTLPRTRSVSAASSTSSAASTNKDRVRPVSLCDTSWTRVTGQEIRQHQLVRSPSQANNLCTTVPQSLVVQNLGGRHTPTRSSLRHSRMLVMARNGKAIRDRRWSANSLGRVGVLVVTAQILVGVMGCTLATWFLMWAPSLRFREVPHYAGVPVFLAGVCGAILISCFHRRRQRSVANIIKGVLVAFCCISIVTCLCVCIFTAFHLTSLAMMSCHTQHSAVQHPSSDGAPPLGEGVTSGNFPKPQVEPVRRNGLLEDPNRDSSGHNALSNEYSAYDDEDDLEGSGYVGKAVYGDEEYPDESALEFETVTLDSVRVSLESEVLLNVTSCACENQDAGRVRSMTYPGLSCLEVNNILPVLFVASCVVNAVGAMLSALILYLLWSFRNSFYGPAKPHETRPFIFTSNFKKRPKETNGSGPEATNGNSRVS